LEAPDTRLAAGCGDVGPWGLRLPNSWVGTSRRCDLQIWPSGNHLGQVILSRLSSRHINRSKDIVEPDLLGIEPYGEKVLMGVIGNRGDTLEGGDGGAHGVRAAASHKPTLLYHAHHPKIYAHAIHGIPPPAAFTPPGWLCLKDNSVYLFIFPTPITTGWFPLNGRDSEASGRRTILAKWQKMTNLEASRGSRTPGRENGVRQPWGRTPGLRDDLSGPGRYRKMWGDWQSQGLPAGSRQGFPCSRVRGQARPREGRQGGSAAPPDFGLHFFLYLRRVFLYYFR
jgi:hypothetical protein